MTCFAVITAATGVEDHHVHAVAATLDAPGDAQRLGACAVEIALDIAPVLQPRLPDADVNIVPAEGRRKRLLIADMDSTMIPVECIDELADFAGVKDRVADITERAMAGELDFEAALRERVALIKGLPETALQDCFDTRISLNPGARTLVRTMNALGAKTALVSGGFTFFTERVAAEAGFAVNRANRLIFADGQLTGEVGAPILGRAAKLEAMTQYCDEGGFAATDVIAVGDGANDLSMVQAAGLGVAYKAKPTLKAGAAAVLDHSDLSALLSLQGIAEAEFST
ncbi:MAG: phosphoserine phosphatase SerB [Pseudomonadota bacterium]